ncbi:MAG: hypothetical protein Q4B22_09645 [Eubacteriales bacterium]|nr:hypothetical protein [Eubacteriales bacterium]
MDINKLKVKARSLTNDLIYAEPGAERTKHAAKRTRQVHIYKSTEKDAENGYTYKVIITDLEGSQYDYEDSIPEDVLYDTLFDRFCRLEALVE